MFNCMEKSSFVKEEKDFKVRLRYTCTKYKLLKKFFILVELTDLFAYPSKTHVGTIS